MHASTETILTGTLDMQGKTTRGPALQRWVVERTRKTAGWIRTLRRQRQVYIVSGDPELRREALSQKTKSPSLSDTL